MVLFTLQYFIGCLLKQFSTFTSDSTCLGTFSSELIGMLLGLLHICFCIYSYVRILCSSLFVYLIPVLVLSVVSLKSHLAVKWVFFGRHSIEMPFVAPCFVLPLFSFAFGSLKSCACIFHFAVVSSAVSYISNFSSREMSLGLVFLVASLFVLGILP